MIIIISYLYVVNNQQEKLHKSHLFYCTTFLHRLNVTRGIFLARFLYHSRALFIFVHCRVYFYSCTNVDDNKEHKIISELVKNEVQIAKRADARDRAPRIRSQLPRILFNPPATCTFNITNFITPKIHQTFRGICETENWLKSLLRRN